MRSDGPVMRAWGGRKMNFEEPVGGDCRIYPGALDDIRGSGDIASVVVNRMNTPHAKGKEVFHDESPACGHRWSTADEALMFELCKAREWTDPQRQHLPKPGDQQAVQV